MYNFTGVRVSIYPAPTTKRFMPASTHTCLVVPNRIGHRQLLAGAFECVQTMDRVIPIRRVAAEIIYSFHVTLTFLRFS
jgi:hypothetical protein